MPLLEDIPGEICGKNFRMDPVADDVIRGSELEENMVVLVESRDLRIRSSDEGSIVAQARNPQILDIDRWCVVTKLEKNPMAISFVGVYCDGNKTYRTYSPETAWYVKYWSAPDLLNEQNLRCETPMPQWERDLLAAPIDLAEVSPEY